MTTVKRTTDTEYELSARKTASRRALNARLADIREHYPEIERKRREIGEASIEFADKMIASPDDSASLRLIAREVIGGMENELREMLVKNGLPADYLELKPVCPVCGDTGTVDGELCSCLKKIVIEKRFSGSGLIPGQTFETFRHDILDDPRDRRILDRICAYCEEYADSFPKCGLPDMLLYGDPGVGKTFLLNAIGERVLRRGYSVLRLTANRLVNETMECIAQRREKPDLVLPDLLIIDDLGTEPMIPNVTVETLLAVICERQDKDRATLFATNKDTGELSEEYGSRIWSRLLTPQRVRIIEMTTPSIRMKKL